MDNRRRRNKGGGDNFTRSDQGGGRGRHNLGGKVVKPKHQQQSRRSRWMTNLSESVPYTGKWNQQQQKKFDTEESNNESNNPRGSKPFVPLQVNLSFGKQKSQLQPSLRYKPHANGSSGGKENRGRQSQGNDPPQHHQQPHSFGSGYRERNLASSSAANSTPKNKGGGTFESRMVFFTCDQCGDALKKNRVQKHTYKCQSHSFSCHDCQKIFDRNNYQEHYHYITEDQKYGGANYVSKEHKGDVKQGNWLNFVRRAIENVTDPKLKGVLKIFLGSENIPRKEKKFINFVMNNCKVKSAKLAARAWKAISHEAEKLKKGEDSVATAPNSEDTAQQEVAQSDVSKDPAPSESQDVHEVKKKKRKVLAEKEGDGKWEGENEGGHGDLAPNTPSDHTQEDHDGNRKHKKARKQRNLASSSAANSAPSSGRQKKNATLSAGKLARANPSANTTPSDGSVVGADEDEGESREWEVDIEIENDEDDGAPTLVYHKTKIGEACIPLDVAGFDDLVANSNTIMDRSFFPAHVMRELERKLLFALHKLSGKTVNSGFCSAALERKFCCDKNGQPAEATSKSRRNLESGGFPFSIMDKGNEDALDFAKNHLGKYMVIKMDFACANATTAREYRNGVATAVGKAFAAHNYLLQLSKKWVPAKEKRAVKAYMNWKEKDWSGRKEGVLDIAESVHPVPRRAPAPSQPEVQPGGERE